MRGLYYVGINSVMFFRSISCNILYFSCKQRILYMLDMLARKS